MNYNLYTSVEPAAEPVTRAEARLHLRVDTDDTSQDNLIDALIIAAREWAENYMRRSLVRRTLQMRLDNWLPEIRLPRGPVSSVSSVQYVDSSGTQTLATDQYQVDTYSTPARIVPAYGVVWPSVKSGEVNAVIVTYVAGYAPDDTGSPTDHAGNVPQAVKAAINLIVGHLYENRELAAAVQLYEAPFAVKALLAPYEIRDYTLE